jgi:hypothetical protein
MTETDFVKRKGMSYLLTKRLSDCSDEEKEYKREYSRHIKQRYIAKKSPEKYSEYNKEYGKQYYQLHKKELQDRARNRIATQRVSTPAKSRGRPNTTGIKAFKKAVCV